MRGNTKFLYFGLGSILLAVLIWILLSVLRTAMIVGIGIIATNTVGAVIVWSFALVGLVFTGAGSYPLIMNMIKNSSRDRLKKNSLQYRTKTSGLEEIREQLMNMKIERPRLNDDIDGCLEQLDRIVDEYERFDHLVKINEAESVSGARIGLTDIEKVLCKNFIWVINSSIAAENDDSPETEKFNEQCRNRIRQAIDANKNVLDRGNEFLAQLADNISQIKLDGDTTQLDAWVETICEQNKKSLVGMLGEKE